MCFYFWLLRIVNKIRFILAKSSESITMSVDQMCTISKYIHRPNVVYKFTKRSMMVALSWNRTWTFHWYTWLESTIVWTYCILVYKQVKGTPTSGMRIHHFIFSSQLINHKLVLRLLRVVDTGLEMTKVSAAQLIARLWSYSCAWSFHVNYYCIRWMQAKVL